MFRQYLVAALRASTLIGLASAVALLAQQQNAQIDGRILDSSGARIVGATVVVQDASRGIQRRTKTNAQGEFILAELPPGSNYTLSATKPGFNEAIQQQINLDVAQVANFDLKLTAGAMAENITVSVSDMALDTQTSTIEQTIPGEMIEDLPLNGGSTFRLIQLVPGVQFSDSANGQFGDVPANTTFDSNFSINGGRAQSNSYLIDGVPTGTGFFNQITTIPSVDETQQFKVQSSNLSAAYGRFAGGVINVTTKSGTNRLHGSAFERLRNAVFDANTWFNDNTGKPKPDFILNQFGGTLGGPVVLPHLYNGKNKTFFFLSYQGTRRKQGSPYSANVPTAAERMGDFSAIAANLFNPLDYNVSTNTRAPFATRNVIPPSLLDPAALAVMKYIPLPNTAATSSNSNNFTANANIFLNQDVYGIRLDQDVSSRYHLFGRYEHSGSNLTQPNETGTIADTSGAVGTTQLNNQSFAFNNTVTLSPNTLLSVDYGFARWFQFRKTLSYGFDVGSLGTPGWQRLAAYTTVPVFPNITINNWEGAGGQSYLHNGNDIHSLVVRLTKIWGKHELSVGTEGRYYRINFFNVGKAAGGFTFKAQSTRKNDQITTGGNSIASFLLGVGSVGEWDTEKGNSLKNYYGAVYVQDNIRLTPKFTVNIGLRYDGETPVADRNDRLNYFDFNVPSAAANSTFPKLKGGLVFANTGNTGRTVYTRNHTDIAPRLGFAWAPQQNIVFRGSAAIVYAPLELASNAVGTVPDAGFSSNTSWAPTQAASGSSASGTTSTVPLNLFSNPFPSGIVSPSKNSAGTLTELGQDITVWYHHPPTPYSEQYTLDLQFMLPHRFFVDIAYVGSQGVHLTGPFNHNTLSFADEQKIGSAALTSEVTNPFASQISAGTLSSSIVQGRYMLLPYPQFGDVTEVNNPYGHSSYNSTQVKVQKQVSHGLRLLSGLTWSKQMANVNAQLASIGNAPNDEVQDYYNLKAERSLSDLDVAFHFITSGTYTLPFGRRQAFLNRDGWTNHVVGGWLVSGIWIEQGGLPLTFHVDAGEPGYAVRPNIDLTKNVIIPGHRSNAQKVGEWFNTDAFTTPAAYTPGTMRRTYAVVRKPGVQNLDFSLGKQDTFGTVQVQFRVEAFNLFNNPHFGAPDMNVSDNNFGQISNVRGTPPPRELQFNLRIRF